MKRNNLTESVEDRPLPKRILDIRTVYGKRDDRICGNCIHLRKLKFSRNYYKCSLSNFSHDSATDWRKHWPACGRFEEGSDA